MGILIILHVFNVGITDASNKLKVTVVQSATHQGICYSSKADDVCRKLHILYRSDVVAELNETLRFLTFIAGKICSYRSETVN